MMARDASTSKAVPPAGRPFRRAVLRGLGVMLPPLLTIVIVLWMWGTVEVYVFEPVESGLKKALVWYVADVRVTPPDDAANYQVLRGGQYVPKDVYSLVEANLNGEEMPSSGLALYQRYVEIRYLRHYVVVPLFLVVFIVVMYLLGRFMAFGVGRFFWGFFESGVSRLPLVRNVYSSVKKVTDFLFTEAQIEYRRVVAVEYPRLGMWSLGFVTGEGIMEVRRAVDEPVLAVFIPTSPMPMTGFTSIVKKSETIDLDMTVEQAFEFIISCGVVVPPRQLPAGAKGQDEVRKTKGERGASAP